MNELNSCPKDPLFHTNFWLRNKNFMQKCDEETFETPESKFVVNIIYKTV